MARELHSIEVTFIVRKPEDLPETNGEPMYAEHVCNEIRDVITTAVEQWHRDRGHELLAGGEPVVC